jgi:hypothetical protein
MGGPVFDRQVFVKKKEPKKPLSQSPLPGGLVLLLVAALSAFATYRYVKAGGKEPVNTADKAQIAELQGKLKAMQVRVNELEKSHHAASHPSETPKTKNAPPEKADHTLLAAEAPRPAGHASAEVSHSATMAESPHSSSSEMSTDALRKPSPPAVTQPTPKPKLQIATNQAASNQELTALQGNLAANHEEWQATTDRLGNVVGELDSQKNTLQRTQSGVNYLLERVQSSDVSFTLNKGSGLQRVGPISMELASTSVKGQHYSVRMMVDDKSVELKDRALNEVVQFYTSRSQYPLRLIVSQIERDHVSGTLAVPTGLSQESSSHQLQER